MSSKSRSRSRSKSRSTGSRKKFNNTTTTDDVDPLDSRILGDNTFYGGDGWYIVKTSRSKAQSSKIQLIEGPFNASERADLYKHFCLNYNRRSNYALQHIIVENTVSASDVFKNKDAMQDDDEEEDEEEEDEEKDNNKHLLKADKVTLKEFTRLLTAKFTTKEDDDLNARNLEAPSFNEKMLNESFIFAHRELRSMFEPGRAMSLHPIYDLKEDQADLQLFRRMVDLLNKSFKTNFTVKQLKYAIILGRFWIGTKSICTLLKSCYSEAYK